MRNEYYATGPGDVVGIILPERRGDVGNAAIDGLGFANVIHPFAVNIRDVEEKHLAGSAARTVAEPAHAFVPLRAVGWHTAVVPTDSTGGGGDDVVNERV